MAVPRRPDRLLAGPARFLLLPGWLVWRPLVAVRNLAYDLGWAPILRARLPVVSVGNLAAGGTGKTPVTAWIAARLRAGGHEPAIIMRGYRGDGDANDEARMLGGRVLCDPDRVRAAERARSEGATCVVLDDGFQHRRLHRDLDLVLIDALRPWGGGAVLPLGLLREGRRGLRRAHALIITRSDQIPQERLQGLRQELGRSGAPVLCCRHAPTGIHGLRDDDRLPTASLAGQRILLASGIGNPDGFEATARAAGAEIVGHRRYPDHHAYTAGEARDLMREAARTDAWLLVTAKDAVKLAGLPGVEAMVLDIEAEFPEEDAATLDGLLARACPRPGLSRAPAG